MKTPLFLILAAGLLASCTAYTVTDYHPVLKSRSELKALVGAVASTPSGAFEKIALTPDRHFLLAGVDGQGWTVVDVSRPEGPEPKGFLRVPGSRDALVFEKGGGLWLVADSYRDLIVFQLDLGDPFQLTEVARLENRLYRDENEVLFEAGIWQGFSEPVPSDMVAVGYTTTSHTEYSSLFQGPNVMVADAGESRSGAVGSTARFALPDDTASVLYVVDDSSLVVLDLGDPSHPLPLTTVPLGWRIETLFAQKQTLYVGSQSALFRFDIQVPEQPRALPVLGHVTAQDPVVVGPAGPESRDTAFVTLSANGWFGSNQLLAYDVSDPENAVDLLPEGYSMNSPRGLGFIGEQRLLVCEGQDGIRVLDVSGLTAADPLIRRVSGAQVYDAWDYRDVIPGPAYHTLVGPLGLRFYTYDEARVPPLQKVGELLSGSR